ncbi:uncharacterized protein CLUP02_00517 [Colletotrichum lupini]|uniref:Uncharacterized protein n=1 Tax=Colletotrichum lupini TaxID=145971 RepID=A0A9Q8SB86_9PEZI|nr:uncharacterized protein CLUP02_00517 [Colletotrichum lupini]UQC73870.1 hypothetical protein CLUP02_00517 [Colletotrichum lupini]
MGLKRRKMKPGRMSCPSLYWISKISTEAEMNGVAPYGLQLGAVKLPKLVLEREMPGTGARKVVGSPTPWEHARTNMLRAELFGSTSLSQASSPVDIWELDLLSCCLCGSGAGSSSDYGSIVKRERGPELYADGSNFKEYQI